MCVFRLIKLTPRLCFLSAAAALSVYLTLGSVDSTFAGPTLAFCSPELSREVRCVRAAGWRCTDPIVTNVANTTGNSPCCIDFFVYFFFFFNSSILWARSPLRSTLRLASNRRRHGVFVTSRQFELSTPPKLGLSRSGLGEPANRISTGVITCAWCGMGISLAQPLSRRGALFLFRLASRLHAPKRASSLFDRNDH